MPDGTEDPPAPEKPERRKPTAPDREPVLPNRSKEDQDLGWGELPRDQDDWYERERPPHHGT